VVRHSRISASETTLELKGRNLRLLHSIPSEGFQG
jgi:hypothetical protein